MSSLIFVKHLLAAQRSIEVLTKHRDKQRKQVLVDALWDGIWELKKDAERCAKAAQQRGQLLYCHAGTRVFETAQGAHT
ncbi:MAG: hypothetical protein RL758_1805 [Pseudomonadota bacterium]|jgi:hypothetical protein